jgi:flagellar assembly protein FliH
MSLSNIYKGCGKGLSSIRPFDFDQSNDFQDCTLVNCRHAKDTRRLLRQTEQTDMPPAANQPRPAAPVSPPPPAQPSPSFWEEAEQRLNDTTRTLGGAIVELSRLREKILKNSTNDMLQLVMAISRKVIQHEIQSREEVILNIITQAMHAAIKADEFHIKVNPDDFQVVTDNKPLFLASISGLNNITFEADPSIDRGGCLVESDLGQVDATIETKLDEIYQQLFKATDTNDEEPG